jgi:hypothetical protein
LIIYRNNTRKRTDQLSFRIQLKEYLWSMLMCWNAKCQADILVTTQCHTWQKDIL